MDANDSPLTSGVLPPLTRDALTLLTGPLLLGFLFAWGLFGVLCTQVYTYLVAFPSDLRVMRVFVWSIFILELILLVMTTNTAWWMFGSGYGDLTHFTQFDRTVPVQPLIAGLITTLFHAFYAWRIFTLSRNRVLPSLIGLITTTQLAITMYVAIHGGQSEGKLEAILGPDFRAFYTVWILSGIGGDIVVTLGMTWVLRRVKKFIPPQAQTANKVSTLIRYTVETGLLITIVAIMSMIMYLTRDDTFLFFLFYYILTKLYSNTLMSSLNARVVYSAPASSQRGELSLTSHIRETSSWSSNPTNQYDISYVTGRPFGWTDDRTVANAADLELGLAYSLAPPPPLISSDRSGKSVKSTT